MVLALLYAINGMIEMRRFADNIARIEVKASTLTVSLRDNLLAQQRVVGRYLILRHSDLKDIYFRENEDFLRTLSDLNSLHKSAALDRVGESYARFSGLVDQILSGVRIDHGQLRGSIEEAETSLEMLRSEQMSQLNTKLEQADRQQARATSIVFMLAVGGVVLSLIVSSALVYSFSSSITKLQKATHRIADGDFEHDPQIPSGDEIGTLAEDFRRMAVRLKELEQISLDASPLTRLPGNIAIERVLNRHLRDNSSFAMCYLDLDNFKSYNDHYGYIKASELLKDTGRVIYDVIKRLNDPDAFVGHIGGDDFVVVIDTLKVEQACKDIIDEVDALIPQYYSSEDLAAGAISGIERYGVPRMFPLLSISIAALICTPGDFDSAAAIATRAAEVKDQVKVSSGSNYLLVKGMEFGETV